MTAEVCKTVGVPEMSPVVEEKERPLGSDGLIAHVVGVPPPTVAVLVVIARPLARVMFSVS